MRNLLKRFVSLGRALIFPEVTDRVSIDKMESQKLMCIEILSRSVSHEFNNVLSAVYGNIELAQRSIKPGDEIGYDLAEIFDATKRSEALVQGFLAFSRRADPEAKTIKSTALLKHALTLVEEVIPSNISMHKHFLDDEYEVKVSSEKIYQVLLVVLFDALKSMPKGGELHISVSGSDQGKVHLAFADRPAAGGGRAMTGIHQVGDEYRGLAEQSETLEKILGEQGSLEIKSTAEGSNRILTLPGSRSHGRWISEALFEHPGNLISGGIVLFAVLDLQIINPVVEAMQGSGYGVLVMDNSRQALEKFREHPDAFSIIISDLALPGLSGDILAHLVLDQKPDMVVVLCAGPNSSINTDETAFNGVYRVVQNPISVALVNELLASLSLPLIHQVSSPNP